MRVRQLSLQGHLCCKLAPKRNAGLHNIVSFQIDNYLPLFAAVVRGPAGTRVYWECVTEDGFDYIDLAKVITLSFTQLFYLRL